MSRGRSGRRALGKKKGKISTDNVVVIDVDVVVIDAPETSSRVHRGLKECDAINIDDDEDASDSPRNAHDDTAMRDHASTSSLSADREECFVFGTKGTSKTNVRKYYKNVSSVTYFGLHSSSESNESTNASSDSGSSNSDIDSSDCEILEDSSGNIREQWEKAALGKRKSAKRQFSSEDRASASGSSADPVPKSPKTTRPDTENVTNECSSKLPDGIPLKTSPGNSSNTNENTSSKEPNADKLTEDPSSKTNVKECGADSNHAFGDCHGFGFQSTEKLFSKTISHETQSTAEPVSESKEAASTAHEVSLRGPSPCSSRVRQAMHDKVQEKTVEASGKPSPCNQSHSEYDGYPESFDFRAKERPFEQSFHRSQCSVGPQTNHVNHSFHSNEEASRGEPLPNNHKENGATESSLCSDMTPEDLPQLRRNLINERERHKTSDVYLRAEEEEWAARQQQLQIQSEEAHKLRKRKRAERLALDMERRQKERLEEIRESQRKEEETINLKEKLRGEMRKELDIIEMRYRDMASLLRALGIHVEGGPFPMAHEVNAAYKRAVLKFHPDRSSRTDIHQQVESEEKFKLISCLKEKLLPVCWKSS